MKEAMLYEAGTDATVHCNLCNHRCRIHEGKRGICRVRENREGVLYSLVYGKIIAEHIDPIEKKPFFNFFPGSKAYSIGTVEEYSNWDLTRTTLTLPWSTSRFWLHECLDLVRSFQPGVPPKRTRSRY